MDELLIRVTAEQVKMRLDLLLADYAEANNLGLSRTAIQKLIKEGKVFLNSKTQDKPHHKVSLGDDLQVIIPDKEKTEFLPEEIVLDIVYEDDDLLVVNKQSG